MADWGFGVLPDKPQSVVCPLWADIFISEYIGDIENKETINNFQKVIKHYLEIYKVKPKVIVYDKHPGFVYKQLKGCASFA